MKCRVCRGKAVIEVRRHHANFCKDHFIDHVRRQVERTIHDFKMFDPGDRLVLGVSGGKDSLALWDILSHLGYSVDGVYLHLGIGEYSSDSLRFSREFADDSRALAANSRPPRPIRFLGAGGRRGFSSKSLFGLRAFQALHTQPGRR